MLCALSCVAPALGQGHWRNAACCGVGLLAPALHPDAALTLLTTSATPPLPFLSRNGDLLG